MEAPIKRYRVEIGEPAQISIVLVGAGGTGSFAALHLARLAWATRDKGLTVKLGIIDPDVVEAKNIGRQNFAPAEIGQPKAVTLARRYGYAFGLEIPAIVGRFEPAMLRHWLDAHRTLSVVVGAVDNVAARRDIASLAAQRDLWWLDAGNSEHHGQVLIGNGKRVQIDATGYATHLPRPSEQEPGLVADVAMQAAPELSCAELLAQEAQSLMVNQMMASWVGVYLTRLILSRDLDVMATHIDLRSGSARSVPVTGRQSGIAAARPVADDHRGGDDQDGVWTPEELEQINAGTCPECGGNTAGGRNAYDEEELDIVFCPACGWELTVDALTALLEAA